MKTPKELKYTPTHEWVRLDGELAVVGITAYAVEQLGDLAFVDLPSQGTEVRKGDEFGEIESTKTVSQLFAPIGGEIAEVNGDLAEELHRLAESPYGDGWMLKIRPSDPSELDTLLSSADYEQHVAAEEH